MTTMFVLMVYPAVLTVLAIFMCKILKLENVMFNGIKHDECMYNSVEQGFHHIKAKYFRDEKTAEILSEEDRENRNS